MLTLAHDYVLLSLDDHSGQTLVEDSFMLRSAVSAAWIGEMMFTDRLVPVSAGKFALRPGPLSKGLLGEVEKALEGGKPADLRTCMSWLWGTWTTNDIAGWVRDDLVAKGVLRHEQDKWWFIAYNTRHPTADMTTELSIRERLRKHLATVGESDPPHRDDALISLLRASELLEQVWAPRELEALRPLIVERTKRASLGLEAKHAADAARAAVMAATVVAIT